MRHEIEVKAELRNEREALERLAALGCQLSEAVREEDSVFALSPEDFTDSKGKTFLRIRKRGGKVIFTLKQPQKYALDKIEKEVEVSDASELEEIIALMGYRLGVRVNKVRRKAHYNDYEICIDKVENLGSFIEVEKLTEDADGEEVQKELWEFLKKLGIKENDRTNYGYDQLLLQK